MERRFSILESLRFGFYTVIEHFAFFLALMLTYIACAGFGGVLLLGIFSSPFLKKGLIILKLLDNAGVARADLLPHLIKHLGSEFTIALGIGMFFVFLLHRYLGLGFTRINLDMYEKQESSLSKLFLSYNLIVQDAIASLLYWLMCSIGFMFFMLPGIYLALRYAFFQQCIVDKRVGAFEALRMSASMTQGIKWHLFSFWILLLLINALGLSFLGIAMFVTIPMSSLMYVYAYKKLLPSGK